MVEGFFLQGVGPVLAAELCEGADVDPDLLPRELEDAEWRDLFTEWTRWMTALAAGQFTPALGEASGQLSMLGAGEQQWSSVLQLVDTTFRSIQVMH